MRVTRVCATQVGELKQRNHELGEALEAAARDGAAEAEALRRQLAAARSGADAGAAALEAERRERARERGGFEAELEGLRGALAAAQEAASGAADGEKAAALEQRLAEVRAWYTMGLF